MNSLKRSCIEKKYHPTVKVLAFLVEQKVAFIPQIYQYCFQGQSISYARKVLSFLERERLISRQSVLGSGSKFHLAFQVTPKGLQRVLSMAGLEPIKIQLKSNYQEHDVVLTDFRLRFAKCKEVLNFIPENLIQSKTLEPAYPQLVSFRAHRCDGSVQLLINGKIIWLAVEFERANKSSDKINDRVLKWYQSEELRGILLVAEDDELKRSLISVDRKTYPHQNRKVFFSTLSEMKSDDSSWKFQDSNGNKIILSQGSEINIFFPFLEQKLSKN